MDRLTPPPGPPPPAAARHRLRALYERVGEYEAARMIGVGSPSIARGLAGLGLRRASATAITLGLDRVEADETATAA